MSEPPLQQPSNPTVGPDTAKTPGVKATWPDGFVWGVSTSSYQIEGAADEDGRGPSIWDTYCRQPGRIANADTGDVACDHYHRFRQDIALMRELGVTAYRFSVSWSRVLPVGRGATNPLGLAFYNSLIDELLAAGIEPWLCLYHWDLPQALDDLGGWQSRDCAGWFADYASLIAAHYGDRVKRFATFNEPSVFTLLGYGLNQHPPGIADREALLRAIHHVNLAHGAAVDVMRAAHRGCSLGCIYNWQPCIPATEADTEAANRLDAYWNTAFPDPQLRACYPSPLADAMTEIESGDLARINRPVDWFGLNHYSPIYVKAKPESLLGFGSTDPPPGIARTDIGWPIEPRRFAETLHKVHSRYHLPIYVLENGIGCFDTLDCSGTVDDQRRIDYLTGYIAAMHTAISSGADIRGYFVWSLLDNFEWASGYKPRFGLIYLDYPTLRRIPKASFRWYTQLIEAGRTK